MEFQHMSIINYENNFHSSHHHRHQQPLNFIVQSLKKSYNDQNAITKFDSSSSLSDSAHSSDESKDDKNHPNSKHYQAAERRHKNFQVKKKTELCKTYQLGLVCPYGNKCSFAHGLDELRNKQLVPANYKTVKCKQFFEKGFCNFGPRCQFLHKAPVETTKTLPTLEYNELFKALMNSIERKSYEEYDYCENEDIGSFGTQRFSAFKNI